jgi:hypothetical protein
MKSKSVAANEMPTRPMNAEHLQSATGGKASSVPGTEMPTRPMNAEPSPPMGDVQAAPKAEDMPTRAMEEPQSRAAPAPLSYREQDKLAAYRRDQAARAAAERG